MITQRTDVSRRTEVEALVAAAVAAYGRLDIMGNIAGVSHDSLVVETEDEDLERILAINCRGEYPGGRFRGGADTTPPEAPAAPPGG